MKDEGPSRQDIERFNRETAYCPDCGAEVWDQAEVCPKCFAYLGGETSTRPPIRKTMDHKWLILLILAVLVSFVWVFLRSRPSGH